MKVFYLFRRLKMHLDTNGLLYIFKSLIYINRQMIVIEKELDYRPLPKNNFTYKIVDASNYASIQNTFNMKLFGHYATNGVESLVVIDNDSIIGFIRWTFNKNFSDLRKLDIHIKENEAYLFDLWIAPDYRGTKTLIVITRAAFNHLYKIGIKKFFGYYFGDNLQALWWHRAIMKSKDIKKVTAHRLIFFEHVNGKFF